MHHDHDIGAGGERFAVARLLIAPVAVITIVDQHAEAELAGETGGVVAAVIVDENFRVDQRGKLVDRSFERLRGVVRGHHHRNALAFNHSFSAPVSCTDCCKIDFLSLNFSIPARRDFV